MALNTLYHREVNLPHNYCIHMSSYLRIKPTIYINHVKNIYFERRFASVHLSHAYTRNDHQELMAWLFLHIGPECSVHAAIRLTNNDRWC